MFQDLTPEVPYKSLSGPAIVAGGDYAHLFLTRADTVTVRYTYHRHHYVHTYLSLRGIASSVVQSLGVTRGLPQEVTRVVTHRRGRGDRDFPSTLLCVCKYMAMP